MSTPALHETSIKALDSAWVRAQFPSLKLQVNGRPAAFLDGPAGTQVPKQVMDAVQYYFLGANANTYGAFLTSRRTDEMILSARAAMADFFNCDRHVWVTLKLSLPIYGYRAGLAAQIICGPGIAGLGSDFTIGTCLANSCLDKCHESDEQDFTETGIFGARTR